jgi:hypothetical protein
MPKKATFIATFMYVMGDENYKYVGIWRIDPGRGARYRKLRLSPFLFNCLTSGIRKKRQAIKKTTLPINIMGSPLFRLDTMNRTAQITNNIHPQSE